MDKLAAYEMLLEDHPLWEKNADLRIRLAERGMLRSARALDNVVHPIGKLPIGKHIKGVRRKVRKLLRPRRDPRRDITTAVEELSPVDPKVVEMMREAAAYRANPASKVL